MSLNIAHSKMKCIFYGDVYFFTTKSILVNTYGNHVSDYTQKITQIGGTKKSSHGMLKIQKITLVAGFFYPRDGCLLHLSKIIFCTCFGVKLCQKSSSGIMLVDRCYAQC